MGQYGKGGITMNPVEHISFAESQSAPKMLSLPEQILMRPDLALVGTGSLSCIRALYLESARLGKTHQFFPCLQSAQSYAAGQHGKALEDLLNQVLRIPGVGGIIVYASCVDILSQTDFEGIFSQLDNPKAIPVYALLRGPMVKRYQKPGTMLKNILSELPESTGAISKEKRFFPPPAPDFQFVSSALQYMDAIPFLLTAGGCGGALESAGTPKKDYRLSHTRFNDIQMTMGVEEEAASCIASDYWAQAPENRKSHVCLMGSAVPAFTGTDHNAIVDQAPGLSVLDLGCDGFTFGISALARALKTLAKYTLLPQAQVRPGLVDILGYCGAVLGKPEKLESGMEYLRKCGFTPRFWGEGAFRGEELPQLNWVVSTAGLPQAEWMKEAYGVPYLTGIPFGSRQMLRWCNLVDRCMGRENVPLSTAPTPQPVLEGKRGLLIGEPLLIKNIGDFLTEELGSQLPALAVYAPMPEQRRFYREICPGLPIRYFGSVEELRTLAKDMDYVIGDPEFYLDGMPLIPLPDPQVSGNRYLDTTYAIFGKEGSAWLVEKIKTILKGETT